MRSIIPGRVRLPGEIVVVASLVTIVDMLMEGFTPDLYSALGIYIPLIVVNCVILGRAEALCYEESNRCISAFDGVRHGSWIHRSPLICIGAVRETFRCRFHLWCSHYDSGFLSRLFPSLSWHPAHSSFWPLLNCFTEQVKDAFSATNGSAEGARRLRPLAVAIAQTVPDIKDVKDMRR